MKGQALFLWAVTVILTTCGPALWGATVDVGIGPEYTYHTIQDGINASSDGDTVLVHDGTYTGSGNKNMDFCGKPITVRSENGPLVTIIDLENSGRAFNFHTGEDSTSVVSGFSITRGSISGSSARGGAIYISNTSPTLSNLIITKCVTTNGTGGTGYSSYGGGIYIENSSSALVNLIVSGNVATNGVGGTGARAYGGVYTLLLVHQYLITS